MWDAFINLFVQVLDFFHSYTLSYGWAIILLVLAIRVLTLPLTMQQLRTTKNFQEKQARLQPKLDELKKKYGKDRDKFAQEQMKLYQEEGMNPAAPLGGCLLALVQMPVWIGLYNALLHLAQQEKLTEGFLFIPTLAQPTHFQWPLPDPAWAYLILPILTVVSQFVTQKMTTPKNADPQQAAMNQAMLFMPLMFGYFALSVPSGLSLYWVVSNVFSMVQQFFISGPTHLLPGFGAAKSLPADTATPNKQVNGNTTKQSGASTTAINSAGPTDGASASGEPLPASAAAVEPRSVSEGKTNGKRKKKR